LKDAGQSPAPLTKDFNDKRWYPITCEIIKGNEADVNSFKKVVEKIKSKYTIGTKFTKG